MIQELDVQKIRKDFPMLQNQNLIYLDSSATSQKPYSVIRAVTDFYENKLRVLIFYEENVFLKEINDELMLVQDIWGIQ